MDAATGKVTADIETKSGAHNTICGLDGKRVYLAGLKSPFLFVADTKTNKVIDKVGPFAAAIRPFTINGTQTLCFVNVNELLGFEVGDLKNREEAAPRRGARREEGGGEAARGARATGSA